ncbi:MAG: hypothetical protein K2X86_07360 [Cytophagaceae bacterium]|nr:hypothetical protein [Cytophagaceae bacterium]
MNQQIHIENWDYLEEILEINSKINGKEIYNSLVKEIKKKGIKEELILISSKENQSELTCMFQFLYQTDSVISFKFRSII